MIETARLLIRPWREEDREPFAAMGQDPEVMATLGPLQPRAETDAAMDRMIAMQAAHGHCFWALEDRADESFLGFCGLKPGAADTPIEGEIEIGWRLRRDAWGKGLAREAAEASLKWGFANLMPERIVAITAVTNARSWGLMERLGMTRQASLDFDHPLVPEGDPLKPHVVYFKER